MQYATYRPGVMAAGLAVAVLLAMTTAAGADADPTAATEKKPAAQPGRWLPGDMHSHISPPDVPPKYTHAKNDLEGAIRTAREARLAWLVITPHAMDRKNEKTGRLWAADMADQLAKRGTNEGDPLVVLGWERTYQWPGHMTVSFVRLETVCGQPLEKVLQAAHRQGGLTIAAHPFDFLRLLGKADRTWKPWTAGPRGQQFDAWLSGLEIRHPTSPAAVATKHWDGWIGRQRRRIIGVGATDDHWGVLYPTTWVYIEGDLTRESLHAALRNGRVVVGSDASAGSLRVTGDPKGTDAAPAPASVGRPGDAIKADQAIEANWDGKGRLFIDGALVTTGAGPFTHSIEKGSFHWVRLEVGIRSISNPVYVNLPAPTKPEPLKAPTDAPEETRDVESETARPSAGGAATP